MFARIVIRFRSALLGAAAAALVLTTTTALAGSGVGGVFNLGVVNTVDGQTSLTGNPGGSPLLKVTSTGTAAAVRGVATNGIGTNGVSTSGVGQQGLSDSGTGTLGTHGNNTGVSPGVQGETNSTDPAGAGVVGKNNGGGPGLKSIVLAGAPPLAVNSSVKVTNLNSDLLDGLDSTGLPYWKTGGNAGTTPGTNFLGTTDNQALELMVNGQRALRIEPESSGGSAGFVPNLIGGSPTNVVKDGASAVTIAGGGNSTVGGSNIAYDNDDTIGGGQGNVAGISDGTPVGGAYATVGGGDFNAASGADSTIPGGFDNTASGRGSFAAGTQAKATQDGAFVWGDDTITDLTSPAADTFTVRASGGIWLGTNSSPAITSGHFIDTSTGAYLTSTGTWTNNSDRAKKYDLRSLDSGSVLHRIARMPITSWSYKGDPSSVRHIGPMAQDFYKAFGLGLDNKHITTIDEGGIALAAIQGLFRQNQALERRNQAVERENRALDGRLTRLERVVAGLEH